LKTFKHIDDTQPCKVVSGTSLGTVKEFQNMSKEYFKDNEYTRFPPKYYLEKGTAQRFGDMIEQIHKSPNSRILTGYNPFHHLKVLGFQEKDFDDCTIDKYPTCNNVLTILVPDSLLIVVCVVVDGNDEEEIQSQLQKCNDLLKATHIANRNNLADQYIAIIGTLVLPTMSKNQLQKSEFFFLNKLDRSGEILFVTKDELDFEESLNNSWWNNVFKTTKIIKVPSSVNRERRTNAVKNVAAEMMVSMSVITTYLPKATYNTAEKIATLLLNTEQIDIIQDKAPRKVITSNFGCGKSICLKEIARQLSNKNDGSMIYYLCYDPYSLLEVEVEEYFKTVIKSNRVHSLSLKEISNDAGFTVGDIYTLSGVPSKNIAALLEDIQKKNGKCHFLIDEMHLHNIDNKYCDELLQSLDATFSEATIAIASQSVMTSHTLYVNKQEQYFKQGNLERAGFKSLHLNKSMRMSSNLFQLVNVASKIIDGSVTFIPLVTEPRLRDKVVLRVKNVFKRSSPAMETSTSDTTLPTSTLPSSTSSSSQTEDVKVVGDRQTKVDVSKFDDPSMVAKRFPGSLPNTNYKIVKQVAVETKFVKGICGTKIKSNFKPQLIFLNNNFSFVSEVSGNVLATILEKFCLQHDQRTTLICNNLNEVTLATFALETIGRQFIEYAPYLKGTLPSREQKVSIVEKLNNNINSPLVTDYRSFRGCETEHCVLFIDPNETFANHVMIEVMTRATAKLDIIVYPSAKLTKSIWSEIFAAWDETKDETKETIILKKQIHIEKLSDDKYKVLADDKDIADVEVKEEHTDMLIKLKESIQNKNKDISINSFR